MVDGCRPMVPHGVGRSRNAIYRVRDAIYRDHRRDHGGTTMAAERWTVTGPQTIELDGVTALSVRIIDGRVDVVAHDEPTTRVEVHAVDGRPIEVRLEEGGRLVVGHETLTGWKAFF